MLQLDRFDIVVPLHEISGWRRALAVDRGGVAPRAVVISYPPAAITDDPTRLVGLMRDAEAAALVHHPNAVPALGLETAGDLLVAVEAYRRGVSLRTLLGVARRLPPELAARVAVDACAAVAAVHAVDPGDGHPLAHGGISAERLLVADDGATLLCGTGTAGGGAQADDVKAVGAVLRECLLGDPSAPPVEHAGASEIPPQVLEVMRRAVGDSPEAAYADAEALAGAIREAIRPAPPEAMAAYLEAILPAGEGERGELLRLVASALSRAARPAGAQERPKEPPATPAPTPPVAEATGPAVHETEPDVLPEASRGGPVPAAGGPGAPASPEPVPRLVAGERPAAVGTGGTSAGPGLQPGAPASPDLAPAPVPVMSRGLPDEAVAPAKVAPAPPLPEGTPPASPPAAPGAAVPRPARSRLVLGVAIAMTIVGFGGGILVARGGRAPVPPPSGGTPAVASPVAVSPPAPGPAPQSAPPAPAVTAAPPPPTPVPEPRAAPAARSPGGAAAAASISVSAEPPGEVYVDGKRVGRSPLSVPVPRGDHEVRLRSPYEGVDVRRHVTVRGAGTPVRFALRRGSLKVTAPQDAEVFVDGKRVGRGDVKVDLWEGNHVVEARLGEARVHEKFTLGPGETWTYDVTPTP